MIYKIIQEPNDKYNAKQQILINRGIKEEDLIHYMNTTDDDINDPELFGKPDLQAAVAALTGIIQKNEKVGIVVDADCDGYTSAALLINFLYKLYPTWTEENVDWFIHEGKQHGLEDSIDWALDCGFSLIIVPDAGSNDYEEHKRLMDKGIVTIILDHHEAEKLSPYAIVLNNQLSDYPNKDLSGVGVTWQFCRYFDRNANNNTTDNADYFLDLVALGNMADMMSLRSIETKHLIQKGFLPENIKNPFIFEMWQKNKFKLGEHITPMGAAFYIAPFVNAMVRSGEADEKQLLFNSMLTMKAFKEIPSNKRGHKLGEMERVVDQAVRTCTNVKNRQTRAEDAGLALIEKEIEDKNMLQHKVLLFLMQPGEIDRNIAGLIANKIMAKYQRPCCILTETKNNSFEGSARGCDKTGITNFKDICEETGIPLYAQGHQGAFGLGLPLGESEEIAFKPIYQFLDKTDEILKDTPDDAIYYVDYIYSAKNVNAKDIIEIAELSDIWGKDMDEAYIAVEEIEITKEMLTMMASNTAKISLPNGINIIKFRMPDEEFDKLYSETGMVVINAVCRCNINEWNGQRYAQLFLEDYNIVNKVAYVF